MEKTMKLLKIVCAVQTLLLLVSVVAIVLLSVRVTNVTEGTVIVPVADGTGTTATTMPQTVQTMVTGDVTDIGTPYGTVQFPSSFTDVHCQSVEQDGVYSLQFMYVHDGEDVEAFAIHFGDEERGSLIGYVLHNDEQIPFTVTSADASVDEDWSQDEQEYFKSLMMAVNNVIASIQLWDTYCA